MDADELKTVTKDDVYNLFMTRVHPSSSSRSKLSVQMRSQKVRPKHVSSAAAKAFEALIQDSGMNVAADGWKEALSDETPGVEEFKKYWEDTLAGKDGAGVLLEKISELLRMYPVEGEGEDPSQPGATYIGDMKEFRATLQPSVGLGAMVHWGDLPVSKF